MTLWSVRELFGVVAIGRRLGLLLVAVAAYCVGVGAFVEVVHLRVADWGSATRAINTLILGLLMSFRNRAAYDRLREARRLA